MIGTIFIIFFFTSKLIRRMIGTTFIFFFFTSKLIGTIFFFTSKLIRRDDWDYFIFFHKKTSNSVEVGGGGGGNGNSSAVAGNNLTSENQEGSLPVDIPLAAVSNRLANQSSVDSNGTPPPLLPERNYSFDESELNQPPLVNRG